MAAGGTKRFSSGLGTDAAALAACGAAAFIAHAFFASDAVTAAVMAIAPAAAVIFTGKSTHGLITAVPSAAVCAILWSEQRSPAVCFLLLLASYLALAAGVGYAVKKLTERLREADMQYRQAALINEINQSLLTSTSPEDVELLTLEALCELTGKPGVIYGKTSAGVESRCILPRWLLVYPTEIAAATAAFETGERCGLGTDTFGSSAFMFMPITAQDGVLAVAAMRFGFDRFPDEDTLRGMELILRQAALMITRQRLIDAQHNTRMEAEKEKVRNDFLRAISHDLRTPLAGIISACSTLNDNRAALSRDSQRELVQDIYNEADWLARMVENLLSVTRVSEGVNMLDFTLEPVDEIIWDAAKRITARYPEARLNVSTPEDVLMVEMDALLIVQVLMNLIENAVKYSHSDEPVSVSAWRENGMAYFNVTDRGHGLSDDALASLFTARASRDGGVDHGLGIGLSICRSIILAHNGTITGENTKEGGASFSFALPLTEAQDGDNGIDS